MKRKGIILAGGSGTRLWPLTDIACKQLLPVYDKPMIYYPLSTLMLGGIEEILIISTEKNLPSFRNLFGDGSHLGMSFEYAVQKEPKGIAEALLIGENFLNGSGCSLILGDNLFYGRLDFYRLGLEQEKGATIYGYPVKNPRDFGVVEFDRDFRVLAIEEKPAHPRSQYAIPGLYIYDEDVCARAKALSPSARGELEITDLNRSYLADDLLKCIPLGRGIAWLDTGTPSSLLEASHYIATIENQQKYKIACIEEIALNQGFVTESEYGKLIESARNPDYRAYLEMVLADFQLG
jgi:glucose-1-phosphate thymidylyltransferase